ncbi:MAG: helicase HerA-like domain-containing protein [Hyphomonadaceae bacterium]
MSESILIGAGGEPLASIELLLKRANRHGLVAGATGTGKTVTLQVLAEGFSRAGVPVFAADIKGDLSGMSQSWEPSAPFKARAEQIGLTDYKSESTPVVYWDLYGQKGHPIRTTITEMGPTLLARLMEVSDAQEGALAVAFKMADEEGLFLLDMKDLKAILDFMAENDSVVSKKYGLVTPQSIAALQRKIMQLDQAGADGFFGEPALDLRDFMRTDLSGKGIVNILAADRLVQSPTLYSTFLLWMLSELFEQLPEVGDMDRPKMVFFFDEAHLLFRDAPKALLNTIEQVVRLIRSKGVGIYFVTQNPQDIPETVLAQLGNRVQHALRAYTPSETKAVRIAAESFRPNPRFKTEDMITALGVGEALVSTLDAKGIPTIVERTFIRPPLSQVGPCLPEARARVISASPIGPRYDAVVDRDSAFEILERKAAELEAQQAELEQPEPARSKSTRQVEEQQDNGGGIMEAIFGTSRGRSGRSRQSLAETAMKTMVRQASSTIGRELMRGLMGSLRRR